MLNAKPSDVPATPDASETAQVFSSQIWLITVIAVLAVVVIGSRLVWPQHLTAQTSGSTPSLNLPASEMTSSGLTPSIPNPALTPGDVLTTDVKTICTPGYTQTVRNVPSSIKKSVYAEYGIMAHKPGDYEVDHLISLELGGSNSVRNLWPESFITKPLNAHIKDDVENKLHALVCSGQLPIQTAQQAIASNWVAAYAKYVGPLPR